MTDLQSRCRALTAVWQGTPVAAIACLLALAAAFSACQSGGANSKTDGPQRPLPGIRAVPTFKVGLSVEEAYAAIPHRRTVIQLTGSKMPQAEKDYLELVSLATDQAVLLRVATYRSFSRGETEDPTAIRRMEELIEFLQSVDPPSNLKTYHKRLEQAVSDQKAFFEDWQTQGSQFEYARAGRLSSHPKVSSSSAALKEAYGILMRSYPQETRNNKDAFFDYLCALDFL